MNAPNRPAPGGTELQTRAGTWPGERLADLTGRCQESSWLPAAHPPSSNYGATGRAALRGRGQDASRQTLLGLEFRPGSRGTGKRVVDGPRGRGVWEAFWSFNFWGSSARVWQGSRRGKFSKRLVSMARPTLVPTLCPRDFFVCNSSNNFRAFNLSFLRSWGRLKLAHAFSRPDGTRHNLRSGRGVKTPGYFQVVPTGHTESNARNSARFWCAASLLVTA